jgi:hypothetical protein
MALAAYFDASGHQEDQKYLVVAGFVSSPKEWINFDRFWTERLKKDGLQYFHANEFAQSVGQFNGWRGDEKRRRSLSEDLMAIIKSHVFRMFGCIVINKVLAEDMSKETRDKWLINAYSLAGRDCVGKLRIWQVEQRWNNVVPELIFEDGDIGKGLLSKALVRDGFSEPIFRPKKDRVMSNGSIRKGLSPLQPADWLAYEFFLATKTKNVDRWPLQQFILTPGFDAIGIIAPENLQLLSAMLTTPLNEIVEARLTAKGWIWD